MESITAAISKKELRRQTLARIAALDPAYTRSADRIIIQNLLALPEYGKAACVFCFVGTGHEISTAPFLERVLSDGKILCVPLCTGKRAMEARRITSLSQLRRGFYGLLEPDSEGTVPVAPEQIDLAIIPCVTCSRGGERLGHGGGYYDTYFSQNRAIPSVMICREQILRDDIPREAHDLIFPVVVTEGGIFRNWE